MKGVEDFVGKFLLGECLLVTSMVKIGIKCCLRW